MSISIRDTIKMLFGHWIQSRAYVDNPTLTIYDFSHALKRSIDFDYHVFSCEVIKYLEGRKIGKKPWEYGFCTSSPYVSIYSASYALMLKSFFYGPGAGLNQKERSEYITYFLDMQDSATGYFIDNSLQNGEYISKDNDNYFWWGYGHALLHVIICLTILDVKPVHKFKFLDTLFPCDNLNEILESYDWGIRVHYTGNIIMNYGVALQYQALFLHDNQSMATLRALQKWLSKRANAETGLWGELNLTVPLERSVAIQAAYHFWPLFTFETFIPKYTECMMNNILATQNSLGGYGIDCFRSTGCEDMDSIEPLVRFLPLAKGSAYNAIINSLRFAFPWVLTNQNPDGGFVFSRDEPFQYGHEHLSAKANESNLMATWWRVLSIAYLSKALKIPEQFYIINAPGLCFPVRDLPLSPFEQEVR